MYIVAQIFFKSITNNIINTQFKRKIKQQSLCFLKLLIVVKKYYGLIHYFDDFMLVSFPLAKKIVNQYKLEYCIENNIIPQSCFLNIQFLISRMEYQIFQAFGKAHCG